MKLTLREKILLAVLGFVIVIAAEVYFLFIPQADKIKSLAQEQLKMSVEVQRVKAETALYDKLQKDCEALASKVNEKTVKFYPEIKQDKIIVILDELFQNTKLKADSASFTVTEVKPVEEINADPAKSFPLKELVNQYKILLGENAVPEAEKTSEAKVPAELKFTENMTVTVQYSGSYEQLVQFIKSLEGLNRNIVIDAINMLAVNSDVLTGSIKMNFYTLPKITEQDKEYYDWPYNEKYGKSNPFKR